MIKLLHVLINFLGNLYKKINKKDIIDSSNNKSNKVVIFFDTMIFVHFPPINEMEILKWLNYKKAKIIIPMITINELDKIKNTHNIDKIRERAKKRLDEIIEWDKKGQINNRIKIELKNRRVNESFIPKNLNIDWNDDQLIAEILEYKNVNKEDNVILITNDVGPKLTAKEYGIESKMILEKWKLPHHRDELFKENKRLKNKLLKLEKRLPKLILRLSKMDDEKDFVQYVLKKSKKEKKLEKEEIINKLKKSFPQEKTADVTNINNKKSLTIDVLNMKMNMKNYYKIEDKEYKRYNNERKKFFENYMKYLCKLEEYQSMPDRTIELNLEIRNIGSSPATDIDVNVYFPDGFKLYTEGDLPQKPQEPKKPTKPRTNSELILQKNRFLNPYINFPNINLNKKPFSYDTFNLEETDSYVLTEQFDKIKHGMQVSIRTLYLVFDKFEEARSFNFTYELNVGNLPDPVEGKINVIIKK